MTENIPQQNSFVSDEDVQLMLRFQQGDKAAFEKLMVKYYPRVLNFIYRYCGIREIAEDLTQEVFVKVYKNVQGYQPQAKIQTWLFTIARNISLNELRRLKRPTVSLDESIGTEDGQVKRQIADENAVNVGEQMMQSERALAVQEAINELPENQRMAVILRRYENMSYEEIAQAMNTSIKAVKSLLNRAKETLKIKLSRCAE